MYLQMYAYNIKYRVYTIYRVYIHIYMHIVYTYTYIHVYSIYTHIYTCIQILYIHVYTVTNPYMHACVCVYFPCSEDSWDSYSPNCCVGKRIYSRGISTLNNSELIFPTYRKGCIAKSNWNSIFPFAVTECLTCEVWLLFLLQRSKTHNSKSLRHDSHYDLSYK